METGGGTGASSVGVNFSNPTESIANIVLGLAGDGRLVFAKDGTFLAATSSKKSVGLGLMTYEKKDKENLRLTLSMDVPVLGSISGSLDCKYRLEDRNTLVLTIYGNDIYLTRAKGEKPKEYVKAAKEADFLGNFFGSRSGFGEQIDQFGKDIKDGIKDNLDIDVDDALDDFKDGIEDNLDIDVDDALDDLKDGIEDNLDIDVDDTMDSLKEGLNSLFGK